MMTGANDWEQFRIPLKIPLQSIIVLLLGQIVSIAQHLTHFMDRENRPDVKIEIRGNVVNMKTRLETRDGTTSPGGFTAYLTLMTGTAQSGLPNGPPPSAVLLPMIIGQLYPWEHTRLLNKHLLAPLH